MTTTPTLPTEVVTGLLEAIAVHLTIPQGLSHSDHLLALRGAAGDVRLACAAILGQDVGAAAVTSFTRLLNGQRIPLPHEVPALDGAA